MSDNSKGEQMGDEAEAVVEYATRDEIEKLAGVVGDLAGQVGRLQGLVGGLPGSIALAMPRESTSTLRNDEEGPGPRALVAAAQSCSDGVAGCDCDEPDSTLCNGEGEPSTVTAVMEEEAARFRREVEAMGHLTQARPTFPPAEFIPSEREHPAPPSPAFDPRAASETCSHTGCRRRAFAVASNAEGDKWLDCAEHYEQDLAAQARSDGHEPAWRVPIAAGVVLERWRGGPIGVKVDGELRSYVTAGELARIFEGPVG